MELWAILARHSYLLHIKYWNKLCFYKFFASKINIFLWGLHWAIWVLPNKNISLLKCVLFGRCALVKKYCSYSFLICFLLVLRKLSLASWSKIIFSTYLDFGTGYDCKEIQPVHSKGDQPWDFFGRNDAEAETPVLWPPHAKSWLIGKEPDAGRDWGQEEKGMTEDEMAGWHNRLDRRESQWTRGVGVGQGGLACCDSWGRKESDTTEWLIWYDLMAHMICSIRQYYKYCLILQILDKIM